MATKTESRIISSLGLTGKNDVRITSEAMKNYKLAESAESDLLTIENGDYIYEKLDDGTYAITGRGTVPIELEEIVIPSMYAGATVTEIGESLFYQDEHLSKVTIPNTIRYIGEQAFYNSALQTIVFQDTDLQIVFFKRPIETWGTPYILYKFLGSSGTEMNNGEGVMMDLIDPDNNIYASAVPSKVREIVFCSEDKKEDTRPCTFSGDTELDCHLFQTRRVVNSGTSSSGDVFITVSYTIPTHSRYYPSVDASDVFCKYGSLSIGTQAFAVCDSLQDITLPRRLVKLGVESFAQCGYFNEVYLSKNGRLTEIGSGSFKGCGHLYGAYFGSSIKKIGESAFENCKEMVYYDFQDGLEEICANAFKECTCLTEIEIPSSVKRIHPGAFFKMVEPQLPKKNYEKQILFENPYTWVMTNGDTPDVPDSGEDVTVWKPEDLITSEWGSSTSLLNGDRLSGLDDEGHCNKYWHRLERMLPPQISTSNGILHMTDPLGVAEKFYIYVNGDKSSRITIDLTTTGS